MLENYKLPKKLIYFLHITGVAPPTGRFLELTPEDVLEIENARNEKATDMQTKVYIKIVKGKTPNDLNRTFKRSEKCEID